MPDATGIYIVKALWIGNNSYPRTEVTANLAILSFEDETVFSVASNSTVSGLAFDATSQELRFNVSGLTGSTGYADVCISKTLIDRILDVQVFVNGGQVDFESMSLEDAWCSAREQSYHVLFNRKVSWSENMRIVAWVSLLAHCSGLHKWCLMQCIKESSTLRVSSKREKSPPRIVYRFGNQNEQIQNFLRYRKIIKNIIKKLET